mgnify:FL=1
MKLSKIYSGIQSFIPVTKSELNIVFLIIVGLLIANAYDVLEGNALTDKQKEEFIRVTDSLFKAKKVTTTTPSDFSHIPKDSLSGRLLKIDPNLASIKELQLLKGVGIKTAERIVLFREKGNYFSKAEDLLMVKGIGPATLKKFENQLVFKDTLISTPQLDIKESDSKPITNRNNKVNINTASLEELCSLPGIGKSTAKKILDYRNNKPFKRAEDLMNIKGIGKKKFEKLKEFIEFS